MSYFIFWMYAELDGLFEGEMFRRNFFEKTGSRSNRFTYCTLTRARCTREGNNGKEGLPACHTCVYETLLMVIEWLN